MRFFKSIFLLSLTLGLAACSKNADENTKTAIEENDNLRTETPAPSGPQNPSQEYLTPCVKKDLASSSDLSAKVIYGDDNRLEYCETSNVQNMALSDSTAVVVRKTDLIEQSPTVFAFDAMTYGQQFNLCKDEPFRDQLSVGFCSGFLVAPDTIVTAGHCVRSEAACSSTSFVFGFNVKGVGAYPISTTKNEVYNCAKLVKSVVESAGKDYAVVKLDRPVVGHNPLKLRQSGSLKVDDSVVVMGYPSGIPLKISGGAKVRSLQNGFFVANLDTYGGNSGSAVFNEATGEVEGILVRGEADFVTQGTCRVSNKCANDACRGEDVTNITEVLGDL